MRLLTNVITALCSVFLSCPKETPHIYQHKTECLQMSKKVKGMILSDEGEELLKHLEGYKEKPYLDSGGRASIGYGHMIRKGELFTSISEQEATNLLLLDIEPIEDFLNENLRSIITQNQFDALVIFIFNIGIEAFSESHVYEYLKNRQYEDALDYWAKWINVSQMVKPKGGGKPIKVFKPVSGLINRRAAEIDLFNA